MRYEYGIVKWPCVNAPLGSPGIPDKEALRSVAVANGQNCMTSDQVLQFGRRDPRSRDDDGARGLGTETLFQFASMDNRPDFGGDAQPAQTLDVLIAETPNLIWLICLFAGKILVRKESS